MPDIGSMMALPIIITVVSIIAAIVITIVVWRWVAKMANPNAALMQTGEPAQATILRIWDTGMSINDNPMVGMALQVQPQNRPAYQVETKCLVSRLRVAAVQPGATVNVMVDPVDLTKVAVVLG